jgi:hypothetical protein
MTVTVCSRRILSVRLYTHTFVSDTRKSKDSEHDREWLNRYILTEALA